MVGAHEWMPDMLDGYGILAQAEIRGVWKSVWYRGTITETLRGWEEGRLCTYL